MRVLDIFRVVGSVFLVSLIVAPRAHAYIDPGTGAVLAQILVGTFAALGVFFRKTIGRQQGCVAFIQADNEPAIDGQIFMVLIDDP